MCKCRSHGTFPLFGLQSSHLNICYYHQDPHRRPLRPGSRPRFCSDRRALLLIGAWHLPRRPGVGRALKRHPFSGLVDSAGFDNDPSAGSPTETLLRLLLPLNDKVQWNSRDVAGGEPPTSPRS
ncbi:hypothetical protein L2E82_51527 [Cichorium intybus]|nr:hypothetical protein L2E82_51527 [Cichorium intybus]